MPVARWLLGRWALLRELLDQGMPQLVLDKLKAIRLQGRHHYLMRMIILMWPGFTSPVMCSRMRRPAVSGDLNRAYLWRKGRWRARASISADAASTTGWCTAGRGGGVLMRLEIVRSTYL